MAKFQAHVIGASGTLYYSVRRRDGQVLKDNGTFVEHSAAGAAWTDDCLFPLVAQGATGVYMPEDNFESLCTPPPDPGVYTIAIQEGNAYNAPVIAFGSLKWDGTDFPEYAAAGEEMDLVDAPNATAITAIQDGLAVPGDEMTLTDAYDAAKTAAQAGNEMDLVDAPNATAIIAIQDGLAVQATVDERFDTVDTAVGGNLSAVGGVKADTEQLLTDVGVVDGKVDALDIPTVGEIRSEMEAPAEMLAGIASVVAGINTAVGEIELTAPSAEEIADEIEDDYRLLSNLHDHVIANLNAPITSRSDFNHLSNAVTVDNTEACKADVSSITALAVRLDAMLVNDEDKFTADALANTPAGDATEDKQDDILTAIGNLADADAQNIATAVMAKVVDGAVTVEDALKYLLSFATGDLDVVAGPPRQYVFKDQAGETLYTVTFPVDGSGRETSYE